MLVYDTFVSLFPIKLTVFQIVFKPEVKRKTLRVVGLNLGAQRLDLIPCHF